MAEASEVKHQKIFQPDRSRAGALGWPLGLAGAAMVLLLLPISQYLTKERAEPMEIEAVEIAMPPPPPPIEREPPPPEPEEAKEPPELETPPPQLSLDQLDLALNPGTGGNLAGDFGLGNFDVNQDTLGGIDIFEVDDLDTKPQPRSQTPPRFSRAFMRANDGKVLLARIKFILNEEGEVVNPEIVMTTIPGSEADILEAVRKWRYDPPMVQGKPVKSRYVQPLKLKLE